MAQETIKVSQMETLETVTGDAYVMVVVNGVNYKVNARDLYREELPLTTKDALGLDLVDNTPDLAKPISTATQLALSDITNTKADTRHSHIVADVQDLQTELELKSNVDHVHAIADVANLQNDLNNKLEQAALDAGLATKADATHAHVVADVTGLQTALDAKANTTHSHAFSDITDPTAVATYIENNFKPLVVLDNIADITDTSVIVTFTIHSKGFYYLAGLRTHFEYKLETDTDWTIATTVAFDNIAMGSLYTITGLTPATNYQLRMRTVDVLNTSFTATSNVEPITTLAA